MNSYFMLIVVILFCGVIESCNDKTKDNNKPTASAGDRYTPKEYEELKHPEWSSCQ
jgi:hypothetical protein